jgi:hypothetical protein
LRLSIRKLGQKGEKFIKGVPCIFHMIFMLFSWILHFHKRDDWNF